MRISLYRHEKGFDYSFIDQQISEMFQIGGAGAYLHKYIGPKNPEIGSPDQPIYDVISPVNIQDLLFLENRDRKYANEVYNIRGYYSVQNIDFNISQFGLFFDNDTIFMTVHINDFIKYIGRKPLTGDVIELPNLRDDFAFSEHDTSLPRFYAIEDVGRASEGFSATWYPHLYRLKLKKISDTQQFADILNKPVGVDADKFVGDFVPETVYYPGQIVSFQGNLYQVKTDNTVLDTGTTTAPTSLNDWHLYSGTTTGTLVSTKNKELEINDALLSKAELDAPLSGYDTRHLYTLTTDANGKVILATVDLSVDELNASSTSYTASDINVRPPKSGYLGYLVGDGYPQNGYNYGHGIQFPQNPGTDDFFLRLDYLPNRLFRYDGRRWIKMEDNVRMELTPTNTRMTQKTSFINNIQYSYFEEVGYDPVTLSVGDTEINTNIDFITAAYVTLRFEVKLYEYVVSDFENMLESYTDNLNQVKLRINLPIIDQQQQTIPANGVWQVTLFNYREQQRQSLKQALRPRADL